MPNIQFCFGALQVNVRYVQWREGLAYFRRRIPQDLKKFYPGEGETLFYSLQTRRPEEAAKAAHLDAQRQDAEWTSLRQGLTSPSSVRNSAQSILKKHGIEPGQWGEWHRVGLEPDSFITELEHLSDDGESEPKGIVKDNLPPEYAFAAELFFAEPKDLPKLLVPTLSEVKQKHLEFYPKRATDEQFQRALDRFIALNGDLPVDHYRRAHGNAFIKDLLDDGRKGATVKRYLAQIRPVFETAILELDISMSNPLSKLRIPEQIDDDDTPREPFTLDQIRAIQSKCREANDQRRWLISSLSDTGCRLAEVAGLMFDDVQLDSPIPYISIQPNSLRSLKTASSKRKVPLVGEALWAIRQAMERNNTDYVFPALIKGKRLDGTTVSATLNAWLWRHELRNKKQPLHSFRHSLRDRLRNAGVPPDVQDRIGGWASKGVGEGYGAGHSLEVLHTHMVRALEPNA